MAGEDRAYLSWLRLQGCLLGRLLAGDACEGAPEANHTGDRGLSQRAHDHTAIPLCAYHHRCWHDHSGWFRGWRRDQRREWAAQWVARMRAAYQHETYETGRET